MLVLVGPDGYVSKYGAQLPINQAGFHIRTLNSLYMSVISTNSLQTLPSTKPGLTSMPRLIVIPFMEKPGLLLVVLLKFWPRILVSSMRTSQSIKTLEVSSWHRRKETRLLKPSVRKRRLAFCRITVCLPVGFKIDVTKTELTLFSG